MEKAKYLLLSVFLVIALVGCSAEPVYYSKKYVKEYVKNMYGEDCKYVNVGVETDEDGNDVYIYNFTDGNGVAFCVYASTDHVTIDASTTIFYEKEISDNYLKCVYDTKVEELEALVEKYSLDAECKENKVIWIWLDSYTQLEKVAEFVEEADVLLDLEYNGEGYDGHRTSGIAVAVFLKPDDAESGDEWKDQYGNRICSMDFSSDKEKRLKADEVFTTMERALVDGIKTGSFDQYKLADDVMYKYPAPYIKVTSVNGNTSLEETYSFGYDVETDSYWISGLDLCQDFEEFPYNYTNKGKFAGLVELLGGTYSCDDWTATWEIQGNKWTAKLETTDSSTSYRYKNMTVERDGKEITLSDPQDKGNGTVSGRSFTVEDLEKMLGVDVEIDQVSMTATITFEGR